MAEQIVPCPYCVLGDHSGPMLQRPEWFICEQYALHAFRSALKCRLNEKNTSQDLAA